MITQKWADSDSKKIIDPDNEEEVEYDHLEDEKIEMQARSKDNLVLKFDKHSEKIQEIFEKHSEPIEHKPKIKSSADDETNDRQNIEETVYVPHAKLKNIGKIFDDIAYLTGISILSYMEYVEGASNKKNIYKSKR